MFMKNMINSLTKRMTPIMSRNILFMRNNITTDTTKSSILSTFDNELAMKLRFTDKVKHAKPTTPGKRHLITIDRSELYKGRPIYELTLPLKSTGGRNNQGRVTTQSRGGGHKKRYRLVDFKRSVLDQPGKVVRLEHDPNRNAYIALVEYENGTLQYIIAPQDLKPGDTVIASRSKAVEVKPGNAMLLRHIPIGSTIHCIELLPKRGAQIARSAGTSCQLLEKENSGRKNHALVRIASKEYRLIPLDSLATIGIVSNPLHRVRSLGKAGRNRWLGVRPHVRGLSRNPVDHPHGGGAGAGRAGRPSCGPTGVLAKGFKTRRVNRNSVKIVVPRGGMTANK